MSLSSLVLYALNLRSAFHPTSFIHFLLVLSSGSVVLFWLLPWLFSHFFQYLLNILLKFFSLFSFHTPHFSMILPTPHLFINNSFWTYSRCFVLWLLNLHNVMSYKAARGMSQGASHKGKYWLMNFSAVNSHLDSQTSCWDMVLECFLFMGRTFRSTKQITEKLIGISFSSNISCTCWSQK